MVNMTLSKHCEQTAAPARAGGGQQFKPLLGHPGETDTYQYQICDLCGRLERPSN